MAATMRGRSSSRWRDAGRTASDPPRRTGLSVDLGGLSFLCVLLALPLVRSLQLEPGRAAVSCLGLLVFAALYWKGQHLNPLTPSWQRAVLFVALCGLSALGILWATPAWLSGAVLAAVSAATVLPLMAYAVGGIVVVIASTFAVGASAQALVTVAASGAIAVLRGRLLIEIMQSRANRQAHAETAVENERLRIARDLHDLLGHSLTTMVVKAELAERLVEQAPQVSASASRDVQEVGRAAMAQVQQAVAGYRAATLDEEIEQAQQTLSPLRNGVSLDVTSRVWSREVDAVLAWGLREAVTNILRHANAGRCAITVVASQDTVTLTVVNDDLGGAGTSNLPPGGHGLLGLSERANELGGLVTSGHQQGGTFRLTVELPLDGTPVQHDQTTEEPRP